VAGLFMASSSKQSDHPKAVFIIDHLSCSVRIAPCKSAYRQRPPNEESGFLEK